MTLTECMKLNLDECPICLDVMTIDKNMLLKTECDHIFHVKCLSRMFNETIIQNQFYKCPLCRHHNKFDVDDIIKYLSYDNYPFIGAAFSYALTTNNLRIVKRIIYLIHAHCRRKTTAELIMCNRVITINMDTFVYLLEEVPESIEMARYLYNVNIYGHKCNVDFNMSKYKFIKKCYLQCSYWNGNNYLDWMYELYPYNEYIYDELTGELTAKRSWIKKILYTFGITI